jgi:hypothetical protein
MRLRDQKDTKLIHTYAKAGKIAFACSPEFTVFNIDQKRRTVYPRIANERLFLLQ